MSVGKASSTISSALLDGMSVAATSTETDASRSRTPVAPGRANRFFVRTTLTNSSSSMASHSAANDASESQINVPRTTSKTFETCDRDAFLAQAPRSFNEAHAK